MRLATFVASALAAAFAPPAQAQTFPNRPPKPDVGFVPGVTVD